MKQSEWSRFMYGDKEYGNHSTTAINSPPKIEFRRYTPLAIPGFLSMWFVDDEESLYCHIVTAFGCILLLIAFMWVIVRAIIMIWT